MKRPFSINKLPQPLPFVTLQLFRTWPRHAVFCTLSVCLAVSPSILPFFSAKIPKGTGYSTRTVTTQAPREAHVRCRKCHTLGVRGAGCPGVVEKSFVFVETKNSYGTRDALTHSRLLDLASGILGVRGSKSGATKVYKKSELRTFFFLQKRHIFCRKKNTS